ncbi:MAG TPA: sigma-70 family RNA polymerase sigma factor [Candidatus Acidoferrum sp.]|nr:sigma-70 family RNA polymerase sigma factor [Candidatus Acidoferrum sp.]
MEFFSFDQAYVERLREGDFATQQHFVAYFQPLLHIMMRARLIPADRIDDLTQDTFIRVISALRREGGVRQPERFGAFVNSICKNVLHEYYRSIRSADPLDDSHFEIPDKAIDLEGMLVTQERRRQVYEVLAEMPARDRDLLRAIFLEEKEKDEVCRTFGVDRDYLRVCLHRAKERFRSLFERRQQTPVSGVAVAGENT